MTYDRNIDRVDTIQSAVGKVLIWNTAISGAIAALVVLGYSAAAFVAIKTGNKPQDYIPSEFSNWGGVIIGFYFGSALTQAGNLISAARGSPQSARPVQPENNGPIKPVSPIPPDNPPSK